MVVDAAAAAAAAAIEEQTSETSALNEVVQPKKVFDGFPNLCCPERWFGMNRISPPDWVKLCVDPNGRIKLRAKQKYEMSSATDSISKLFELIWHIFLYPTPSKAECDTRSILKWTEPGLKSEFSFS